MELTLELVMRLLFGNTIGNDLDTLSESFNTIAIYFSKIMSQNHAVVDSHSSKRTIQQEYEKFAVCNPAYITIAGQTVVHAQ